jgi:hypothetical protein
MTRTQLKEQSEKVRSSRRSGCSTTSRKTGLDVIQRERSEAENEERIAFLRDKKLQIYDSHAVDYSRFRNSSRGEESLLHLRKNKQTKAKNRTKKETKVPSFENEASKDLEHKFAAACALVPEEDVGDFNSVHAESVSCKRFSATADHILTESLSTQPLTQTNPHDTLTSFLKHYREQRSKDERLKAVQSQAKFRKSRVDQQDDTKSSRKCLNFLPPLIRERKQANKSDPDTKNYRTGKLPKIPFEKRRGKTPNDSRDPRFQKLVSALTPTYTGVTSTTTTTTTTTTFPLIASKRRRSYTT